MGKQNDYMAGRAEGIAYALRIAEVDGIEGLRAEVKARGITGLNLNISHKELAEATDAMRRHMFDTMSLMAAGILADRWGFSGDDVKTYLDDFKEACDLLENGVIEWEGIRQRYYETFGEVLSIYGNDRDTILKRRY